ncbi:MAG: C13 family peptidase [Candidatus Thorarchaeota archaeon]
MKLNINVSETIKEDIIKIISEEGELDLQTVNLYLYTDEISLDQKITIGFEKEVIAREKTGMVFVDLKPEYNWAHPCKYYLYSLNSNTVIDKIDAEFPPPDFYSKYNNYEPFHQPVQFKNIIEDRAIKAKKIPFLSNIIRNAPGNRYAILFSGMSNNRHTNDLEFLYRTLTVTYGFDESNIYVLNYDGEINYQGASDPIGNWPGDNTPYQMSVYGPGSRAALDNVFDILKSKLENDDLLLIHTNNHGGSSYLCCYPDWDRYFTSDYVSKLSSLPQFNSLIVMMEQCHSGVFSDPTIYSSPASKTHFAAACEADKSSIGGANFDPFAYDWIAAITGHYADGSSLNLIADINADNRISAKEAFEYAYADKDDFDTPNSADSPSGCGACLFLEGFDICLKAYFDYPAAKWKDDYQLIVEIQNTEEFDIVYNLECKERETNNDIITIEDDTIPGGGSDTKISNPICQDWIWISNTPCATLSGAVSKEFNYDITFIIKIPVNYTYPIINLKKNVAVSDLKLSYRSESNNFCTRAITHYSLAAVFFFIAHSIAVVFLALAISENVTAINLNNQANDPIEFDKNYSEIHDFSPLIRKVKVEGLIPIHIKRFGDRYNKIGAQFNSLDITYNRFYSSLKVGDKNSARIQKERAINLAELMEEDLIKMKNHLLKIKKFDEDLKKIKIEEDDMENVLKSLKEKGLSEEYKERLTKQGLSKQMIERINETSGRLRKEDLRREIYHSYQNLYHHILGEFLTKKEKIKDMRRAEGLSEEKLMRRLQKKGLIERKDEFKSGRNQERKRRIN